MKLDLRNRLSISLFLFCLLPSLARGEELSASAARMLNDVKVLASDEFEGRGVGTEGLQKAAKYVAEAFREAGLNVTAVDGDPFQHFEITDGVQLGSPNSLTFRGPDGQEIELKLDQDFRVFAPGGSGTFSAPVAFVGYGIEADDIEYNDYANIDVRGKVVIVMRRNPKQDDHHGPFAVAHGISRHAALTTKLSRAFSRGAVAVLFVNDPFTGRHEREHLEQQATSARGKVIDVARKVAGDEAPPEEFLDQLRQSLAHLSQIEQILSEHDADPLMEFGYGGTRSGKSPPSFHVTKEMADRMLSSAGTSLAELEAEIDRTGKPRSRLLADWTVSGEATLEVIKVPVQNVLGVLEGSGPRSDETIVVGAHIDHLGYGGEGSLDPHSMDIHSGADDNASGVAGMIELARRLSAREQPLPRRIVFIGFTGEERGLLGSEEYVKSPVFPLERTIAMFNMDMIGRMVESKLTVFGTGTSPRWNPLIDKTAEPLGLQIFKKPEGFGPSDHSSFYARQIPVLHLFTGTHSDYHRPSDNWDKINARGMQQVTDLLEQLVVTTAETPERPPYVHVAGTAQLERTGSRPYFGVVPNFGTDAEGCAIQGVSPGSPAEKGGLRGGDVIVRLGDDRIGGLSDFDLALRKFSAGDQVNVVVLREGKEVTLKVTLATPRG